MNRPWLALALLASFVATTASPAAAGGLFYLIGKLGSTSLSEQFGDSFSQAVDGDDNSFGLGAGVHLGQYFALQVEYHDYGSVPGLGSPCSDAADVCIEILVPVAAESRALSVAVLPQFPLTDRFTVYGKAGIVAWESEVTDVFGDVGRVIDEYREEDLIYGLGLRLLLPGPFDFFTEYERTGDAIDTLAVGITVGY